MKVIQTALAGVLIIEPRTFHDQRGFFMESYNSQAFAEQGLLCHFVQDNHSLSVEAGTVRGLHYQLNPRAQSKLLRVLSGEIYDVVVDIRKDSHTYGQWMGITLSEANQRQVLIPKGFAHGYCTIAPHTQVLYKVDEYYSAEHERGICWNDPALGIDWPTDHPILSDKDQKHPLFQNAEMNF